MTDAEVRLNITTHTPVDRELPAAGKHLNRDLLLDEADGFTNGDPAFIPQQELINISG